MVTILLIRLPEFQKTLLVQAIVCTPWPWLRTNQTDRFYREAQPYQAQPSESFVWSRDGSQTRIPKIRVTIYSVKWNSAWVITGTKTFLMQILTLLPLLLLEIWRHKIPNLKKGTNSDNYPSKLTPCQFQQYPSRRNVFIFKILRRLDEKEVAATILVVVLRIKIKNFKVWASYVQTFQNNSCKTGVAGQRGTIGLSIRVWLTETQLC